MSSKNLAYLPPREGQLESLEGLYQYLASFDPKPKATTKKRDQEEKNQNLLQKAKAVLWAISQREYSRSAELRRKAQNLIQEVEMIETYCEDTLRYDAAIRAPGCRKVPKAPCLV